MARKSYRKRYYKRSNRWAANIQEVNGTISGNNTNFYQAETILKNPAQSPSLVTQVFTVKNIEINFNLDIQTGTAQYIEAVTAYIMYVPQGMNVTSDYNTNHPEYIMAYKYIGSPTQDGSQQYQPIKVRTRLARKLQSGDNIILFIKGLNQSADAFVLRLSGLVRWWTKAN